MEVGSSASKRNDTLRVQKEGYYRMMTFKIVNNYGRICKPLYGKSGDLSQIALYQAQIPSDVP